MPLPPPPPPAESGEKLQRAASKRAVATSKLQIVRAMIKEKIAPNATLPPGWEERLDTTSGKMYYIDHNTKTTSWERPPMAAATAVEMSSAETLV